MQLSPSWSTRLRAALGSLKLRITLGAMVALAVGIGSTTFVLVGQAERATLTAMRDRELNEAVRTATALSRRVVDLQRSLQLSARSLDVATLQDDVSLLQFMLSQPLLRDQFNGLMVVDATGQVRMLVDDNGDVSQPRLQLADRPYFQRAIHEQRPIVSEALMSRASGEAVIVFAQPLVRAGVSYGVLTGALNLATRDLLADLVDVSGDADEVLRVVADAEGRILAHPNRALLLAPLSAEPRLAPALQKWQISGSPVEPGGLMLAQRHGVVSAGGVAGPDWVVWRFVDEASLFGPLHAARRHALLWAVLLVLLSSVLVLLSLWWLLRPLKRLGQRAEHLLDESRDPRTGWPITGGEIGQLAHVLRRVGLERSQLETANGLLLQKLSSVMSNAPVGIAFTRVQRFEVVSAEFCRLFGYTEDELLGQPTQLIHVSLDEHAALGLRASNAFSAGTAFIGDLQMRRADGNRFWAHLRGRLVDQNDDSGGIIWTVTDVSEEIAARTQLEWSASHDLLTGLVNRKVFEQRLERMVGSLPGSLPAALVMIDLDHFKPVNDRAGHAAGDAMLQAVAEALRTRLRSRDLAARLGGDEFALLLEHCPHEMALRIAEEVLEAIDQIVLEWGTHRLRVGASLGVASLSVELPDVAAWLRAADVACYQAKADGRGRVRAAPLVRSPLRVISS